MFDSSDTLHASVGAAPVRITTLGRFAIEAGGVPVASSAKGQRKPLALLKAVIALGGQSVPTDQLCESLWPDADGDNAQRAFSIALHRLREIVGREALPLAAGRLSLDAGHCFVDALEFQRHLAELGSALRRGDPAAALSAVEAALALYRGPFLDGEFEPVEVLAARERLHAAFLRQVGEACDALAAKGDSTRALGLCRRALEVDPVAEELVRRALELAAGNGSAAEGRAAFERYRDLLGATADAEPHRDLLSAYERLKTAAPVSVATGTGVPRAAWRRYGLVAAMLLAVIAAGGAAWQGYGHWRTAAAVAELQRTAAHPLPDSPSIAVLAFESRGDSPDGAVLAEAISETIITDLVQVQHLFVIARETSFQYKGKPLSARELGRELGVRNVLQGSVLRDGEQLRINVQLIDAATGKLVWAGRFDRAGHDLFALLDEISTRIVTELEVTLVEGEQVRFWRGGTTNLDAYILWSRALVHLRRFRADENLLARSLLEKALKLDPDYPQAIDLLAWTHLSDGRYGWSASRKDSLERAWQLASQARAMGKASGFGAYILHGNLYLVQRQYDDAIREFRAGLARAPNFALLNAMLGSGLTYAGQAEEAIPYLLRSMRLSPHVPVNYLGTLGDAYRLAGRHQEALATFERILARSPDDVLFARPRLVALLVEMGRLEEARTVAARLRELDRRFSVARYGASRLYRDRGVTERMMEQLRRAGLPE